MSGNIAKLYEVMRRIDEAISEVEKRRDEAKANLDEYVNKVKEELRASLEAQISELINSYRTSAEESIGREVEEYLRRGMEEVEKIRANRGALARELAERILKYLNLT